MRILIADDTSALPQELHGFFTNLAGSRQPGAGHAAARLIVSLLSGRRQHNDREHANLDLGDQQELSSSILDALGLAFLHNGSVDEARPLIEAGLRIRREFYGEDHPATASSLISHGRLLRRTGDIEAAAIEVRRALTINARTAGPESLAVAITLSELASIEIQLGEFTGAEQSAQSGLRMLEALHLQCTDPHVTRLMDSLGRVSQVRGDYDRATEIYTTLLDLDRKQVGEKHLKYVTHLVNFATVEAAQGKLDEAKAHLKFAIGVYENELKLPRHPDLIDTYANLGSVLRAKGDTTGARDALKEALDLDSDVRGAAHPFVGNDHARLGRVEYESGDFAAAEGCFNAALQVYSKAVDAARLPADHAFIAEAKTWKSRVMVEASGQTRAAEAEGLINEALLIWKIEFGERSVEQSIANAVLGHALALQPKELDRAAALLSKSYPIIAAVRGADSKIALLAKKWLDEVPLGAKKR